MRPAMYHLSIRVARADAVFASGLQRSARPTAEQIRRAVAETVRAFGSRGCAARVAQEFGDHPETAAERMRWARTVADVAFGTQQAPVRGQVPVRGQAPARGQESVCGQAPVRGQVPVRSQAPGIAGAVHTRGTEPGGTRLVARHAATAVGRAA